MSNVRGINRFRDYMTGLGDGYVVIGGTACDILFADADLPFRATKDIDMALIVESKLPETAQAVWQMIHDGGYRLGWRGSGKAHFYRFTEPADTSFPSMIELFSRSPDFLLKTEGITVAPLPIAEEISSLSAILLDDGYYTFMKNGRRTVDGITVLDAAHLIPFKAKACIDLASRREAGEKVDAKDVKKHKNDAFRLVQLLAPSDRIELSEQLAEDMASFVKKAQDEGVPLKQIGVHMPLEEAISFLKNVYGLDKA